MSSRTVARVLATAAAAAGAAVAVRAAHRAQLTWGASPEELAATLPGDGLVPQADLVATRAITIDAAPEDVWPWVVQLGQGRGGFYSYDVLENLVGLGVHSAQRIVPEWQGLAVGDPVHLAEQFALTAAVVDPPHALVLEGAAPLADETAPPYDFTWAFVVQPARDGATRLVVRERYGYKERWVGRMVVPVSWLSFLMSQRMLRGIRDRAQGARA